MQECGNDASRQRNVNTSTDGPSVQISTRMLVSFLAAGPMSYEFSTG
jgi:hypothetical protein